MGLREGFVFARLAALPDFGDAFVGRVSSDLRDSMSLLDAAARALAFPDYFGRNANALRDCLTDFDWIGERRIVLLHEALPDMPRYELWTYLDLLQDAVAYWRADGRHELSVVFDESCRSALIGLMGR